MPAIDWKYPEFKGVKSYWDTEKKRYVRSKKYQDFLQEKEKIKRRGKFAKLPKEEQISRLKKTPIELRKDLNPEIAAIVEVEEKRNIKRWEKNTDLKFDDVESINSQRKIRRGTQLGIPPDTQFKRVKLTDEHKKNIKIWEKNTGKKYKDLKTSHQHKIRNGLTTGGGKGAKFHPSILALRDAFVADPDMNVTELAEAVYGDDFAKGSLKEQRKILTYLRADVPKFLETSSGTRKVPGFKKIPDGTMLDIIDNINSNKKMFGFADEHLRHYNFKIRDMTLGQDPNMSLAQIDQLNKIKKGMGLVRDETAGLAATFERAPAWTAGTQLISDRLNNMKSQIIDRRFSAVLQAMIDKDPNKLYEWTPLDSIEPKKVTRNELATIWNQHAKKFKKKHKIDAPLLQEGLAPEDAVKNFELYSKPEQASMNQFFKTHKFSIGLGKETQPLAVLINKLVAQGENGGPVCKLSIIRAARGGKAAGGPGIDCSGQIKQVLQENPDQLIKEAVAAKVKPGENTGFRNIARQVLNKIPKGGRLGAILAGAGAVGLGAWSMTGDAEAQEPRTTDQMSYNPIEGKFVNPDGDPESQEGILNWIADHPIYSGLAPIPVGIGLGLGAEAMNAPKVGEFFKSMKFILPPAYAAEKLHQYKRGDDMGQMFANPLDAVWAMALDTKDSRNIKWEHYKNLAKTRPGWGAAAATKAGEKAAIEAEQLGLHPRYLETGILEKQPWLQHLEEHDWYFHLLQRNMDLVRLLNQVWVGEA